MDVERLSLQATDVKPVNIQWTDSYRREDEDERPQYWETFDYELDGERSFTLLATDGYTLAVVHHGGIFESWEEYEEQIVDTYDDALTEAEFDELLQVEPYQWGSEGPMMNYWYPVNERMDQWSRFDPKTAALQVDHVPLCVVEVDGQYGLALTGGGMDLSWEICAGYVALGMCPPVHFADLPNMKQLSREHRRDVLDAMQRSLEVEARRAERMLERITELREKVLG